jgi:riboflavin synthase
MFTGIIEATGILEGVNKKGDNLQLVIQSPISKDLKPDQSVSHNGICLTVEESGQNSHIVTAIAETLQKTNLKSWKPGQLINLERCMTANSRFDGHIVQGHIDGTGRLMSIKQLDGSRELRFSFPEKFAALVIEKGSISLEGISLTLFDVSKDAFSVAIIPYTLEHTNLKFLSVNDAVNLEFDIVGKYIQRMQQLTSSGNPQILSA